VIPHLADGVELIGKYEDSGFKEEPYLVRRPDGQMIQMPRILYLVAESIDGESGYGGIAANVSERARVGVDADGAQMLIEERLRPLGLLTEPDGSTPEIPRADPLLALKLKTAVIPEGAVNAVATLFRPLFFGPVVATLLVAFFALDVWLFVFHGVAQSVRQVLYDPLFILLLLGLVVLSAAFHECGHATACKYGGARPGPMGAGIYLVWPAFYTDVTDAYRLGKRGRLRTDLGGVYFNAIFSIATFAAYFVTGWEPLLLVVPLQIMEMLHQFLPFLRLDGYYIVSDLTGVPDMFARIKPTLKSLNPLHDTPEEVHVLKPWVRGAVTLYVLTVVPLLLILLGLTVINTPRVLSTAWDSMLVQNAHLHRHVDVASYAHVALDALQMSVLVLPVGGLAVTFWKLGRTIATGLWDWAEGRRLARFAVVVGTAVAAFAAAYTWMPQHGDYRPIQLDERGTVGAVGHEIGAISTGRVSFTRARDTGLQLGDAPLRSDGSGTDTALANGNETQTRTSTTSTQTTAGVGARGTQGTDGVTVSGDTGMSPDVASSSSDTVMAGTESSVSTTATTSGETPTTPTSTTVSATTPTTTTP
jgi:putative peptide zinc metalloprotease protein